MGRFVEFIRAPTGAQQAPGSPPILSPWPTEAMALSAATDALSAALGDNDEATVKRLGSTAAALVERYAASAPHPIKNEAVIRCAGWLKGQPALALRAEQVGELRAEYAPTHVSALRHSGAMALLSPWKVRRAGAIG